MQNELFQRIHQAVDLINMGKDAGLDMEVRIRIENGPENVKLRLRESCAHDGTYYIDGYYGQTEVSE